MPRYDVLLEGRTESSTCYFGVAVMADDRKEAEYLGHEAGRRKHRECDEIEVVSIRRKDDAKRRTCGSIFDWVRSRSVQSEMSSLKGQRSSGTGRKICCEM